MSELTIVLPATSDDEITEGLVRLTLAAQKALPDENHGFGLGGEGGYGVNHENDVFMMHRFCWCGGDDCPWCCYSGEEGTHFEEKNRAHGALPGLDYGQAPNFWHKATGVRVIWYKWIGRDNVIHMPGECDFAKIIDDCIASLPHPSPL